MTFIVADAIDALIGREGRYSNAPDDPGGETMWGVTIGIARAYGYLGPMDQLPRSIACGIYLQRYWVLPQFDKLCAISEALAAKLFDIGVNLGQATAVRYLQRALMALRDGPDGTMMYPAFRVDGGLGPITFAALRIFLTARGADAEPVLVMMVRGQQCVAYIEDAESGEEKYEWGWQSVRMML